MVNLFIYVLFVIQLNPYYNYLQYCTWAPFMSAGFQVSYVICAALKNVPNLMHNILHTFRLEITLRDPISRC